jgi:hypothetical protein
MKKTLLLLEYKNPSFIKYKTPSFIKYKNPSFIKYKNPSFIKYKNLVLSKHDGVDVPRGITFNNDFTKLFIINGGDFLGGKTVLVYSCK